MPDLHPMGAALNLPRELFSHGIRRIVAKEAARASFAEVVEIVRDYTGSSIAKRQVEELAIRAARDFDAFYEARAATRNPKDDLLIISTDAKGIVMRHEDLRDGTHQAAEKSTRKFETRLTPGEKSNRKRMARWRRSTRWLRSQGAPRTSSTRSASLVSRRKEASPRRQTRLGKRREEPARRDPGGICRGIAARPRKAASLGRTRRR